MRLLLFTLLVSFLTSAYGWEPLVDFKVPIWSKSVGQRSIASVDREYKKNPFAPPVYFSCRQIYQRVADSKQKMKYKAFAGAAVAGLVGSAFPVAYGVSALGLVWSITTPTEQKVVDLSAAGAKYANRLLKRARKVDEKIEYEDLLAIYNEGFDSGHFCKNFPKLMKKRAVDNYVLDQAGVWKKQIKKFAELKAEQDKFFDPGWEGTYTRSYDNKKMHIKRNRYGVFVYQGELGMTEVGQEYELMFHDRNTVYINKDSKGACRWYFQFDGGLLKESFDCSLDGGFFPVFKPTTGDSTEFKKSE